jgi:hypothetical protein
VRALLGSDVAFRHPGSSRPLSARYIRPEHIPTITALFPSAIVTHIEGARPRRPCEALSPASGRLLPYLLIISIEMYLRSDA